MIFLNYIVTPWFLLVQFAHCDLATSYNPEKWPRHVIKLSEKGTLKDIFDSGIRPFRFPSLERTCLDFKHSKVFLELESGEKFQEINVEYGEIYPLLDGFLSKMELNSPKLTVQQAELQMAPFILKGKRTREQLIKFLALAAHDPRDYENPYDNDPDGFTTAWNDVEGLRCYVGFKSTFDPKTPVRFVLGIAWDFPIRTPIQQRSFYEIPIPPPPGYESVSMEAPRNFGPDSAAAIEGSKRIQITGDHTPEEFETQRRLNHERGNLLRAKSPRVKEQSKLPTSLSVWGGLMGLLGILITAVLVLLWKQKPMRL
jgi:hypothetical protein